MVETLDAVRLEGGPADGCLTRPSGDREDRPVLWVACLRDDMAGTRTPILRNGLAQVVAEIGSLKPTMVRGLPVCWEAYRAAYDDAGRTVVDAEGAAVYRHAQRLAGLA